MPSAGQSSFANRAHRRVERSVLAWLAARGHPVGRQAHVVQRTDVGSQNVGDRLGDRQPCGSRRIQHRDRRALADRQRLARRTVVVSERHRGVAHRHLPRADQLVAADQAADVAIADGDEKGLVGHRRETQHAIQRLAQLERRGVETPCRRRHAAYLALEARWLAEHELERHVHRIVAEQRIVHRELSAAVDLTDDRERTALAFGDRGKRGQRRRLDRQHVALLRFVAPQLERRQAALGARDAAQVEPRAAPAVSHRLGYRVGQPAGTDVVDQHDRIALAERAAAVDDLLGAPLDLGVTALDGSEIELRARAAAPERGGGAAAQADQHRRPAEHHELRAGRHRALLDMHAPDACPVPRRA